jgi:heme A synthase
MQLNWQSSFGMLPGRVAAILIASVISLAVIVSETPSVQAQNWRNVAPGIVGGIIGAAIVGGALSQQQRMYTYPRSGGVRASNYAGTTRKHARRHKNDEEETTPAGSNDSRSASEGISLAHGVSSVSAAEPQSTSGPSDDINLVRDKAR